MAPAAEVISPSQVAYARLTPLDYCAVCVSATRDTADACTGGEHKMAASGGLHPLALHVQSHFEVSRTMSLTNVTLRGLGRAAKPVVRAPDLAAVERLAPGVAPAGRCVPLAHCAAAVRARDALAHGLHARRLGPPPAGAARRRAAARTRARRPLVLALCSTVLHHVLHPPW